jgi:O-antigen/teichoic acid export membrane protein
LKSLIDRIRNNLKKGFVRNLIVVLTGDGIASIINMLSLSVLIYAIGLDKNGIIIMIQTYCLLFDSLFNFQSFNAIIKYLPHTINNKLTDKTKEFIKLGIVQDLLAATIAIVFGQIFLSTISRFLGWESSVVFYTRIYLFVIIFNVTGCFIGVIRIFNKFKYTSIINVIISLLKLLLYFIGIWTRQTFVYYLFVEMSTEIIKSLSTFALAYKVLKENGLRSFYKSKLNYDKDFIMFNIYTNVVSTLDLPVVHGTPFVMNKLLGFKEIAIYRVYQKLAGIIEKVGQPVNQVLYPEISKMVAQKEIGKAKQTVKKLFLLVSLAGAAAIVFILLTYRFWLGYFIENYNSYYVIGLILYLALVIVSNASVGIHHLYISLGFIKYSIPIIGLSNLLYLILLYFFTASYGLIGVIVARCIQAFMVIYLKYFVVRKNIRYIYES